MSFRFIAPSVGFARRLAAFGASTVLSGAVAFGVSSVVSTPAHAQWGKGQSLYTQDGIEVTVDARVFAVVSMLNSLGYDVDTRVGPPPLAKPLYSDARQKVRKSAAKRSSALKAMGEVVQKNPVPVEAYIRAALELTGEPDFTADDKASPLAKALAEPIGIWYSEEGGAQNIKSVTDQAKMKKFVAKVDGYLHNVIGLIRIVDEKDQLLDDTTGPKGRVVVVLDEIDAHDTVISIPNGDDTYVIAGPFSAEEKESAFIDTVGNALVHTLIKDAFVKIDVGTTYAAGYTGESKDAARTWLVDTVACALSRHIKANAICNIPNDDKTKDTLEKLAPRIKEYAADVNTINEAMPILVAPFAAVVPTADGSAEGKDAKVDTTAKDGKGEDGKDAKDSKDGKGKKGGKGKGKKQP